MKRNRITVADSSRYDIGLRDHDISIMYLEKKCT